MRVLGYRPRLADSEISGCGVHNGTGTSPPPIHMIYTEAILLMLSVATALIKKENKINLKINTTKQSTTSSSWIAAWCKFQYPSLLAP